MTNESLKENNRADHKLSEDKGASRMEDKDYTTGIYDISNEEYHKHKGISRSAISELKKSPLHYWDKYINPEPKEPKASPAFLLVGSAVHTLVLEPEKFLEEFAVMEKVDLRTTKGKDYLKSFEENAVGKKILREEDAILAKAISKAALDNKSVSKLLSGALSIEKSLFWVDEESGLVCKARPDIWSHTYSMLCDLKTTNDASPENFIYSVHRYNYHIQAAMQIDAVFRNTGELVEHFTIIAAPTDAPHKPYVYELDELTIEQGRREYKDALKLLRKCYDNQKWDLDRETITKINMPPYTLNQNPFHTLMEIYECNSNL